MAAASTAVRRSSAVMSGRNHHPGHCEWSLTTLSSRTRAVRSPRSVQRVASNQVVRPTSSRDGAGDRGRSLADTVLVSNRGPLAFRFEDGRPVAGDGGRRTGRVAPSPGGRHRGHLGGLRAERGRPGRRRRRADDGRRTARSSSSTRTPTSTAWPTTWSPTPRCGSATTTCSTPPAGPAADRRWMEAWEAYRELNELFAETGGQGRPEGGRVLVQDYHLALMGPTLARLRPDLRTVHFSHTPFADPSVLRMLPTAVGDRAARRPWPGSAPAGSTPSGGPRPTGPAAPSSVPTRRRRPGHDLRLAALDRPGPPAARRPIGRAPAWPCGPHRGADRRRRPAGHRPGRPDGAVEEPAPGVLGLRRAARARARTAGSGWCSSPWPIPPARACPSTSPTRTRWSRRWPGSTSGGAPPGGRRSSSRSRTTTRGRWPPSSRYDVLLVNPVRDGLNLVAKEGPLVNTRDGVLALSREAGRLRRARAGGPRGQPVRRDRAPPRCWPGRSTWTRTSGRRGRRAPAQADPRPPPGRLAATTSSPPPLTGRARAPDRHGSVPATVGAVAPARLEQRPGPGADRPPSGRPPPTTSGALSSSTTATAPPSPSLRPRQSASAAKAGRSPRSSPR